MSSISDIEVESIRDSDSPHRGEHVSRIPGRIRTDNASFVTTEPFTTPKMISQDISSKNNPNETEKLSNGSSTQDEQENNTSKQQKTKKNQENQENQKNLNSDASSSYWKNFRISKAPNLFDWKGSSATKPNMTKQQKIIKNHLKDHYKFMEDYKKVPIGTYSLYSFELYKQINLNSFQKVTDEYQDSFEKNILKNKLVEAFDRSKNEKLKDLEEKLSENGIKNIDTITSHSPQFLSNPDYILYQGLKSFVIKGQNNLEGKLFYHQTCFKHIESLTIHTSQLMTSKAIEWFVNTKFELDTANTPMENEEIWFKFDTFDHNRKEIALVELSYDGRWESSSLELIHRFFDKVKYKIITPIEYIDISKYDPGSFQEICYFIIALDSDSEFLPPTFLDLKTKAKLKILNRIKKCSFCHSRNHFSSQCSITCERCWKKGHETDQCYTNIKLMKNREMMNYASQNNKTTSKPYSVDEEGFQTPLTKKQNKKTQKNIQNQHQKTQKNIQNTQKAQKTPKKNLYEILEREGNEGVRKEAAVDRDHPQTPIQNRDHNQYEASEEDYSYNESDDPTYDEDDDDQEEEDYDEEYDTNYESNGNMDISTSDDGNINHHEKKQNKNQEQQEKEVNLLNSEEVNDIEIDISSPKTTNHTQSVNTRPVFHQTPIVLRQSERENGDINESINEQSQHIETQEDIINNEESQDEDIQDALESNFKTLRQGTKNIRYTTLSNQSSITRQKLLTKDFSSLRSPTKNRGGKAISRTPKMTSTLNLKRILRSNKNEEIRQTTSGEPQQFNNNNISNVTDTSATQRIIEPENSQEPDEIIAGSNPK